MKGTLPSCLGLMAALLLGFSLPSRAQIIAPIFGTTDKAVLTLKDSTVVRGYNRLTLDFGAVVGISETPNGRFKTFASPDILSLDLEPYPYKGQIKHYETTRATMTNSAFAGGKVMLHPIPLLLQVAYEGENVTGYLLEMQMSEDEGEQISQFYYYYKCKGAEFAEIFWEKKSNQFWQSGAGMKNELKKDFQAWPAVVEWLDSKEYKSRQFTKNPFIILEVLDRAISEAPSSGEATRE